MPTTEAQRQKVRRDLDRDNRRAAADRYHQRCICPHCHGRGCSKCS